LGAAPFEKIQRVETLQDFIYTYIFVYIYYIEPGHTSLLSASAPRASLREERRATRCAHGRNVRVVHHDVHGAAVLRRDEERVQRLGTRGREPLEVGPAGAAAVAAVGEDRDVDGGAATYRGPAWWS